MTIPYVIETQCGQKLTATESMDGQFNVSTMGLFPSKDELITHLMRTTKGISVFMRQKTHEAVNRPRR